MVLDFRLDDGAQALDQQQQLDFQRGYQVIDAASGSNLVTPAASGLSVDVASGDILHGGTTVSCPQVTGKSLTSADPDDPRVDVVYRDGNGAVQIKDGAPAPVKPAGGRDRDAYQPAPHDMHDINGVVLATVWVSTGATSIGSGDIRDRRLPASLDVDTLDATSVSIDDALNATSVSTESASITTANGGRAKVLKYNGGELIAGYGNLTSAFASISDASRTNNYLLEVVGDLTGTDKETQTIQAKSHVNVRGNGYRIEVDAEPLAVEVLGKRDAKWQNLTVDHSPSGTPTYTSAIQFKKSTENDFVMENVTAIGQDKNTGGRGHHVIDDAKPTLIDCIGIGGDGGDGGVGLAMDHGCVPTIQGGTFYGGNGGFCDGVVMGNGSPAPVLDGVTGIPSQTNSNTYGFNIMGGAAPTMRNCTGRYMIYPQFATGTGSGSDVVDATDDNYPFNKYEYEAVSTGWPSVLLGVEIRILTAATGATLDIGTSAGGADIANGIDASTTHRVAPNYTRQRFLSGDKIYVTPSDSSVEWNLRYVLAVDQNQAGLKLNTYGETSISNCEFLSSTRSSAAEIGQRATDAKRYSIGTTTFRPVDDTDQVGISGTSDSGATDPIRNCAIFGGTSNINVAN